MVHKCLTIIITVVIAAYTTRTYAQTTSTPSPAPSKTPTPIHTTLPPATLTQATSESTPETNSTFAPLTQQDLTVLTGNVQRPNGATWLNGKIYTACNGDWTIYQIDDTTGATTTYIYGIRNTHTMYIEDDGNTEVTLWVPDFETNTLYRVNHSKAPEPIVKDLNGPWGISYFDANSFLVTNLLGNNLTLINRDGTSREIASNLRSPAGIASDNSYIYVANNGSSRRAIEWLNREDVNIDAPTTHPLVSGLQNTTGLALGSDGYLYFSYSLGTRGVVGRVDPNECRQTNGCTSDQTEIVVFTELAAPLAGLTITSDMRLFIHTIFKPEIYWVQLDSQ